MYANMWHIYRMRGSLLPGEMTEGEGWSGYAHPVCISDIYGSQVLTVCADHHNHNFGVLGGRELPVLQPPQQLLCLVTCRAIFRSHVRSPGQC